MSGGSALLEVSLHRPCWSRGVNLKMQRGQFLTRNLGFCDLDSPIKRCPSRRAESSCHLKCVVGTELWLVHSGRQPVVTGSCREVSVSWILLD